MGRDDELLDEFARRIREERQERKNKEKEEPPDRRADPKPGEHGEQLWLPEEYLWKVR